MIEKYQYTCIVCPISCKLEVSANDDQFMDISGYSCKRGFEYGRNEYICPKRMLTSTVKINGAKNPRLSVISSDDVEKSKLLDCLKIIYEIEVNAPIKMGDIVKKNILNTGVDIVASRSMPKKGAENE